MSKKKRSKRTRVEKGHEKKTEGHEKMHEKKAEEEKENSEKHEKESDDLEFYKEEKRLNEQLGKLEERYKRNAFSESGPDELSEKSFDEAPAIESSDESKTPPIGNISIQPPPK